MPLSGFPQSPERLKDYTPLSVVLAAKRTAESARRIELSQLSCGAEGSAVGSEPFSLKSPGWSGVTLCNMRRILINSRNALRMTAMLPPVDLPCRRGK